MIKQFIEKLGFNFVDGKQLNILALKGASYKSNGTIIKNEDKIDEYNDLIICVFNGRITFFVGTVDPGLYYLEKPMSDGGSAHIAYTQHFFVKGLHTNKPALRAKDEKIWIMRDANKDKVFEESDVVELAVGSGLNIHPGGVESKKIGKWSAGCINICGGWFGVQWFSLMNFVDESEKNEYPVTVWFGKDYVRFKNNPDSFKPTLKFGCIQQDVKTLQLMLGLSADGVFGGKTLSAVKQFQQKNKLEPDGIVGDKTWEKLKTL